MTLNWRKTIIVVLDIALAAYLVLAITAFNKYDDSSIVCSEVNINISDNATDGFLNFNEIKRLLRQKNLYPLNQPISKVDTRTIEETLLRSAFVDKAQCYKTQSGHVFITINQRMPVIRIMADNGEDYYVDNHGGVMPNSKYTSDIIIATGSISKNYAQKVLTSVGNYIVNDEFWQNQIVQINVLSDGTMEFIPRVGDHIIYIGKPTKIGEKLDRLRKFYKYGLVHAGWNRYSYINIEFSNQIICKKKNNQ